MAVEASHRGVGFEDLRTIRVPWRKVLLSASIGIAVLAAAFLTTNTYSVLWQRHLEGAWDAMVASGAAAVAPGQPVARLVIPDLDLERIVLEGQDRATLRKGPGHVPGSPFPGELGNAIIQGHRLLWSGPFRNLNRLDYGSRILVQTLDGSAVYLVAGIFSLDPSRTDVYADTTLPYLTLITSDPPLRANQLLIVRAVMVERDGEAL